MSWIIMSLLWSGFGWTQGTNFERLYLGNRMEFFDAVKSIMLRIKDTFKIFHNIYLEIMWPVTFNMKTWSYIIELWALAYMYSAEFCSRHCHIFLRRGYSNKILDRSIFMKLTLSFKCDNTSDKFDMNAREHQPYRSRWRFVKNEEV